MTLTVCALLAVAHGVSSRLLPPSSKLKGSDCFSYFISATVHLYQVTGAIQQLNLHCKCNTNENGTAKSVIEQLDHHLRSAEQPASWWHLSSHELRDTCEPHTCVCLRTCL